MMESRNGTTLEWLGNKELKTINFRVAGKRKENPTIVEIRRAIDELECIRQFFEAADPDLIDYAIYMEKAAVSRLSYLFRKAKAESLQHY